MGVPSRRKINAILKEVSERSGNVSKVGDELAVKANKTKERADVSLTGREWELMD
jgi:hypothetical protein